MSFEKSHDALHVTAPGGEPISENDSNDRYDDQFRYRRIMEFISTTIRYCPQKIGMQNLNSYQNTAKFEFKTNMRVLAATVDCYGVWHPSHHVESSLVSCVYNAVTLDLMQKL